jgi:hypothetical protein
LQEQATELVEELDMSSTVVTTHAPARASGLTLSKSETIPWYIWSCIAASTGIMSGLYWDISWHQTIGRDTFWTPAHLLIQFGAILTAVSSSALIFSTTFGRDEAAKRASVNVLGFRGPLGAFISAWGGAAMLVSAPFDNWWHDAYGLDVKIISPPHMLLALGIGGILWGGAILVLGEMNRAQGALRKRLEWMLLLSGGLLVILDMTIKLYDVSRVLMHTVYLYMVASIALPLVLEALARASGRRWARTTMASIYMGAFLLLLWIVPLFPGEPKLGPVYQHVNHMLPLAFPILLVAPALALDLLWPRMKTWDKWLASLVAGVAFVLVLMAVQWPFGSFLMSAASRNWVFGTHYFYYAMPPSAHEVRHVFFQMEHTTWQVIKTLGIAFLAAIVSTRLGITWGNWMREVRR